jgi:DNA-binding NtrC family response regulator
MPTVLVIDDNPSVATALEVLLSLQEIDTLRALSPEDGLRLLETREVDLVVQDMNFSADTTSGEEGVALFRQIRQRFPDLPVILLTAWTHLDAAVDLIKAGAADYLAKPWDDRKLVASVDNLIELGQANRELQRRLQRERRQRRELEKQYDLRGVIWNDPATERVLSLACQVARADVPVLITGPNGAGKERIAEIIQANSAVRDGPFVTLNCGALPSELIEAELFGADAGAYTGASKAREGKFEAADGGTLFLDEIGNLPPAGQMKLLRVLETGRFERLGSNRERQVKVRVISATNADLAAMIRQGSFREDLYYRLNLIELRLPPLAERPGDILPLAEHFLAQAQGPGAAQAMAGRERPAGKTLSESARSALLRHPWPGNVRELKNTMQRAGLLAPGPVIGVGDLGLASAPATASPGNPGGAAQHDIEPDREAIERALAKAHGIVSQAAADLGLSRQALYRRMDRLGIARA